MGIGLFTVVPPWYLYCIITGQPQRYTAVTKPFFYVVFLLFGIKVKVEGEVPESSRICFILCNHQSFIDVPVILFGLFPCAFLAKKSLFKIPYFGMLLKHTNSIPIERGDPQANAKLPEQVRQRLSQNFPLMAFPEGTRSKNGELLPFKNGIFRIIKAAEVPVLPVTIVGAWKVLPKTGISLYPGEIKLIPHKIIPAERIAEMSQEEFKKTVRSEIDFSSAVK
ncbi:MAG: 1-acyl-sn-glycerol-3-phosphate acyltransferase [Fibromonadaceae bacterium]|nr:1-acyl-sn-glycerol-3-phosphate acyltransferase [Fibromonadaceae bacterium]